MLLRGGKVVAAGPIAEAITDATLTECFALPLRAARLDGRWLVSLAERR